MGCTHWCLLEDPEFVGAHVEEFIENQRRVLPEACLSAAPNPAEKGGAVAGDVHRM
jgi:hypothetical protein